MEVVETTEMPEVCQSPPRIPKPGYPSPDFASRLTPAQAKAKVRNELH